MARTRKYRAMEGLSTVSADLIVETEKFFTRLPVGIWTPNVDLCETKSSVTVRVELPGVELADLSVTIQNGTLRVQGVKREPVTSSKLRCYYCLERGYGKFLREIQIDWVIDAQKGRAHLENGVLTVELPKLEDRRGLLIEIPVTKRSSK